MTVLRSDGASRRQQILALVVEETLARGGGYWWRPRGYSMLPVIRDGDRVLVRPVDPGALRPGHVVQFALGDELRLHRLVARRRTGDGGWRFTLRGDNMPAPDPPIEPRAVRGLAVAVERDGRLRRLDTRSARWTARLHALGRSLAGSRPALPSTARDACADVVVHELLSLCRARVAGRPAAPSAEVDGAALLALARRHAVTPLLAAGVAGAARDGALAAALCRDRYATLARTTGLLGLAADVLGALAEAGVPVIALKGLALADCYGDPGQRPMHDVDLLVRAADVPRALAATERLGLRPFADRRSLAFALRFGGAVVLTRDPWDLTRPSIDLHWRLLDDWRLGGRADAWAEEAWTRAEPLEVAGARIATLGARDLVVHLAAHLAFHHAFDGLLRYVDLALALRRRGDRLDWPATVALARRLGLLGALTLALEGAHALLDVDVPAETRAVALPFRARLARRLVRSRVLRLAPTGDLEHVLPLLLVDRGAVALRAAARSALPSREWLRLRYGTHAWPAGCARHAAAALGVARAAAGTTGAALRRSPRRG